MARDPQAVPEVWVGAYRLLTRIGEGGMGVVHLAEAPDGDRVALKVLRPHIVGDDEARERLSREVSSLRRVHSPWVAEVVDADPWGEMPFVATRYVPGPSLHQLVREQGPVRGEDLRWLAAGLMQAVIAVHSVDVLHRDIKPSNVLLEGRSPVLIDFGLARLAEDPRITHTGWLLGTPGYLAPEILYGDDATTASDVHSWAATVVFAATGTPPFGTGPAMAIMDRVRRGEHQLGAVPPVLLPLIRHCLAPDPLDRPTALEVLGSLRTGAVARPPAPAPAELTLPIALSSFSDDDPTARLDVDRSALAPDAGRFDEDLRDVEGLREQRTRPLTVPMEAGLVGPGVMEPARAPYMAPPDPAAGYPWVEEQGRPSQTALSRLQSGLLMIGLTGAIAGGFALAPYLALAVLLVLVWLTRTLSWTTEAVQSRRYRRGRRRWYDAPVAAVSLPWYFVVATGGTVVLLAWAGLLAALVGGGYLLVFRAVPTGLLLMGLVLSLGLWSGPGSRRLRSPLRSLAATVTRSPATGWLVVAAVVLIAGVLAYAADGAGPTWDPAPGPPWREGTMIGDIVHLL